MEPAIAIQDFLEYVVVRLISHPEEAEVFHREEEGKHSYCITVHPEDVGRVVGRNGNTIAAIRSLMEASAQKHGIRAELALVQPFGPHSP